MPLEIVAETEVASEIRQAQRERAYGDAAQYHLLMAIAQAMYESIKIQRDILSILEDWQETQASVHKESTKEGKTE